MLSIIKNMEVKEYSGDNLFLDMVNKEDCWDSISVSTFSMNESILLESLNKTSQLNVVYGLNKGNQKDVVDALLNVASRVEYIKSLKSEGIIENIQNKVFDIRFSGKSLVHSKIFILENKLRYIYMTGSANLTNVALNGGNTEQVVIYDIDKDNATEMEIDFIKQTRIIFENIFFNSEKAFSENTFKNNLKVENVVQEYIDYVLEEGISIPSNLKERKAFLQSSNEIEYSVTDEILDIKYSDIIFTASGSVRKSAKSKIAKDLKLYTNSSVIDFDSKNNIEHWVFDESLGSLVSKKNNGPIIENNKELEVEDIRNALVNFNNIINLYSDEYKHEDETHQIATYLKYTITSPFISQIRGMYKDKGGSSFQDIPLIVSILGRGGTGKTTVLEMVTQNILGINNFIQHSTITNSEKKRGDYLSGFFSTNNVAPLLLDELKVNFFSLGANIDDLKSWSNDYKKFQGCVLTTSNAVNTKLKPEVKRRVLFIPVDGDVRSSSSKAEFNETLSEIDDIVFRVFVERMEAALRDKASYSIIVNSENDYLKLTTEILNSIYEEYNVEMHPALKLKIYDMVKTRGKESWKQVALNNPDAFRIYPQEKDNKRMLLFDTKVIGFTKEIEHIRNYAYEGMISGESEGSFIIDSDILEEFIGISWDYIESQQKESKRAKYTAKYIAEATQSQNEELISKLAETFNNNSSKKGKSIFKMFSK